MSETLTDVNEMSASDLRSFAEQSGAWPFEQARQIVARLKKKPKDEVLFETGSEIPEDLAAQLEGKQATAVEAIFPDWEPIGETLIAAPEIGPKLKELLGK